MNRGNMSEQIQVFKKENWGKAELFKLQGHLRPIQKSGEASQAENKPGQTDFVYSKANKALMHRETVRKYALLSAEREAVRDVAIRLKKSYLEQEPQGAQQMQTKKSI